MRFLRRALRGFFQAILLAVCAALFYLLVIMGDTKAPDALPDTGPAAAPLASLPLSPMEFPGDALYQAAYYFNAPLLTLGGSEWRLQKAVVRDMEPEGVGAMVREVRLYYEHTEGAAVEASSLTPARALRALPAQGFLAAMDQEWMLAGAKAVFMTNDHTLHLHIQKGESVYQIEGAVAMEILRRAAGAAEL